MSYSALRIDDDDFIPVGRSSIERPRRSNSLPFVPLLLVDGFSRKSLSYSALPQEPLRLSVLKLDGSCFDIQVSMTATILELKQAVEAVFSHMPQKGPGKISWPHVWGHFCLCYDNQKLLVETDHIKLYGIKDGDQLHFVRHVSINYSMTKSQSSKKGFLALKQNTTSISRSLSFQEEDPTDIEKEENGKDVEQNGEVCYDSDHIKNPKSPHCDDEVSIEHNESRLPFLLGEWFPYSKLSAVGTTSKRTWAPSIASGLLLGFRKIFRTAQKPAESSAMANMIMASSKVPISSSPSTPNPKPRIPLQISIPKMPANLPKLTKPQLVSLSSSLSAIAAASLALAPPSLAEEFEKAALFDFDLTLPIQMVQFLLLMVALDKLYYSPLGKFMDERDAAIREKLGSVKDTSEEVKQLEEQGIAIMRAARAEISAALTKMKKETQGEVEQKLAEGRKKVEAELQEALAKLEEQKEETMKALDSQIANLSDQIVKKVLPL
ncbi:hypothetical protein DVH24_012092 [Malus domestica]|uniref:SNRNP25 ubiquitin-like domain-containing protein n=1 Tax=Malus domestica TaxID=3750 RepID=A0A498HLM2_MALDO|nr:hypothetical protein DVH24_012092 [Malus domestica]